MTDVQKSLCAVALAAVSGCRSGTAIQFTGEARWSASAEALTFPPTIRGARSTRSLEIRNDGSGPGTTELAVDAPFFVSEPIIKAEPGTSRTVTLSFSPTEVGIARETLEVSGLIVGLEGEGLAVPTCQQPEVCRTEEFDPLQSACIASNSPDGIECRTACLVGRCQAGTCVGLMGTDCDDRDACTVDACGTNGCLNTRLVCPSPGPCQTATCDARTGCGSMPAPDGTSCGADDCLASTVAVCIAGQCVQRARPKPCARRWVPATIPPREHHSMVFDEARGQLLVFGGSAGSTETWTWDPSLFVPWTQKHVSPSPPGRLFASMAYDSLRARVVLFGGKPRPSVGGVFADTWEWDGTSWSQQMPSRNPVGRQGASMAFDPVRGRVLLFGGQAADNSLLDETWEWDGAGNTWSELRPATRPPARAHAAMAWHEASGRIVLVGGKGSGACVEGTWLWNGSNWVEHVQFPSPGGRCGPQLVEDRRGSRLILLGTWLAPQSWTWTGRWIADPLLVPPREGSAVAYDSVRQQVLLFGGEGNELWKLEAGSWVRISGVQTQPRASSAVGYNPWTQRVFEAGGWDPRGAHSEDWLEWHGLNWASGSFPPGARRGPAVAFDRGRRELILFGGERFQVLGDTWVFNGASWTQRQPPISPPARAGHAMAFDENSQRVLLVGGRRTSSGANNTWAWNGSTWTQLNARSMRVSDGTTMAFDPSTRRLVLLGVDPWWHIPQAWYWNGSDWILQAAPRVASSRLHMAADLKRRRLVVLSVNNAESSTLEWNGSAWTDAQPLTSPTTEIDGLVYDELNERVVAVGAEMVWAYEP